MASNRLKLNPFKTGFLWCTTFQDRRLLDESTLVLGDTEVRPTDNIRNLRVQFDSCVTTTAHVSQLVRRCFYHLCRFKTIRQFIPTSAAVVMVNSLIVSRVDYCNSILGGFTDVSATCRLGTVGAKHLCPSHIHIWSYTIRSYMYNRSAARQPTLAACSSADQV